VIIHRLSNALKDVAAQHLGMIRAALATSRELLKSPMPDTFLGRKTQEPFPPEEE
jgi:hypothetical protein